MREMNIWNNIRSLINKEVNLITDGIRMSGKILCADKHNNTVLLEFEFDGWIYENLIDCHSITSISKRVSEVAQKD